jgi:hypothetical protein
MGFNTFLDGLKNLLQYGEGPEKWDMGELGKTLWENRPSVGFAIGDNAQDVAAMSAANKMRARREQKLIAEHEKKANRIATTGGLIYSATSNLDPAKKAKALAAMMAGQLTDDDEINQILSVVKEGADRIQLDPSEYGLAVESGVRLGKLFEEDRKTSLQKVVGSDGKPKFANIPLDKTGIVEGVTPYEEPKNIDALSPEGIAAAKQKAFNDAQANAAFREPKEPRRLVEYWDKEGNSLGFFRDNEIPQKGATGIKPEKSSSTSSTMQTASLDVEKADTIVNKLEKLWNELPHGEGVSGRLSGYAQKGKAALGSNPKVKAYEDFAKGTVAPLVRGLGEKGNLSDTDVERALNAIALYPDTAEEGRLKFQQLKELIADTKKKIKNTGKQAPQAKFTILGVE